MTTAGRSVDRLAGSDEPTITMTSHIAGGCLSLATSKGCRSVARHTSLQIPHPIPVRIPVLPCAIAPRRRHLDVSDSGLSCGTRDFVDTWRHC